MTTKRRLQTLAVMFAALSAGTLAGCSSPDNMISDASSDAIQTDAMNADVVAVDAPPSGDTPAPDAAPTDASATDTPAFDVSSADALVVDVPVVDVPVVDVSPVDVPRVDVPAVDAAAVDAPVVDAPVVDVPRVDVPVVDVPVVDVPRVDVSVVDVPAVDVPRVDVPATDVPQVDVTPVDVARPDVTAVDVVTPVDTGCTGTFTVRVTAPTSGQSIETCTVSGMPVYFNFTAEPSGPATSVEFAWITPEGTLAPPAWPADTTAPYSARRQVGGMMVDVPPLAVLSRRPDWQLRVTARDACGRTAMATQPFTLTYTNHGCPNP